jgi:uncharacterized protein (DUF2235 family)
MKSPCSPISPSSAAPTKELSKISPQVAFNIKKCECISNIGIFFDGTNNNKYRDTDDRADSNIARLYDLYVSKRTSGYSRIYVPGAGTKFPEIGEYTETSSGGAFAFGCEARVIYALLQVFNSLHYHCAGSDMFDRASILALCRNDTRVPHECDDDNLAKLGISHGLLQPDIGNNKNRQEFLEKQTKYLKTKVESGKPRVVECFVDVFGFSRGAAQARVFCNWLNELLTGGRLGGIPLHFRFLGIIDTVASAGFWSGIGAGVTSSTGGHGAWASAQSLNVPSSVKNCVHMVAMHELRRNFPLDEIGNGGGLTTGRVQHAYPGAHSDVGGGYRPGDLGISVGDDSLKLSQIPLNHMLDCAIATGAPLVRPQKIQGDYDPLAIHPNLAKAYADFISHATLAPRPIYEWLQTYLNWRWQVRDQFHTTNQVKRASQVDRDILISFNKRLIDDAVSIAPTAPKGNTGGKLSSVTSFFAGAKRKVTNAVLEPEASEVLARAQHAAPTPPAYVTLFDGYVHDSLAGFNKPNLELTGYWRYRKIYIGTDEHTIAANQDVDSERNTA